MFFSRSVCFSRLVWAFRALTASSPEAYCTTDAVLQNDHRGPLTLYSNRCASLQLSTANDKLGLNCRTMNTCTNRPSKSSRISTCDLKELKRDYILDTNAHRCYLLFVLFFEGFAIRLMCLTTLGWNKCFISSSLVISFGCFFFFMVSR